MLKIKDITNSKFRMQKMRLFIFFYSSFRALLYLGSRATRESRGSSGASGALGRNNKTKRSFRSSFTCSQPPYHNIILICLIHLCKVRLESYLQEVQQHQQHHRYHELPAAKRQMWLFVLFVWAIDWSWVCVRGLTAAPAAPARPLSPGRPRGPWEREWQQVSDWFKLTLH